MPTHVVPCLICQKPAACCEDTHALGIGGSHGEGGCDNPPAIEFCSVACALEAQRRIVEALANYYQVMGVTE